MPNYQFDMNINNGVYTVIDNVRFSGWRYTPDFLSNQNHRNMPKLKTCFIIDYDTSNDFNILKVAIPLKGVITLAPPATVRIS